MISLKVASRYVSALFDLARDCNKIEAYDADLKSLSDFLAENRELSTCLSHPEISFFDKEKLLHKLLDGQINSEVVSVLLLIIKKGHEPDAKTISELYHTKMLEHFDKVVVGVKSPYPLSVDDKKKLKLAMGNYVGKEIILESEIDESLIAGIVITVEGHVIDSSAKSMFSELRAALKS